MSAISEKDPCSALQEKMESQGLVSIQSLVVRADDDEDTFQFPSKVLGSSSVDSMEDYACESFTEEDDEEEMRSTGTQISCGSNSDPSCSSGEDEGSDSTPDRYVDGSCLSDIKNLSLSGINDRSISVVSDGSEEGARDSGIEIERDPELSPMVIPEYDLMEKITTQVEFYFSDANVVKDKFLLKHIRRNKEGYVSLKLVSSFKKVKQLTKDWRVVAYSLERISNLIEINEQRTKIRRVEPLPEIDDSPVTSAVLVLDLPLEKPTVESVSRLFSSVGDIAFIRVLRAGGVLPSDVKSLLTKYQDLGVKHCAWVEFESPESAKSATRLSEGEGGMRVYLIVPESLKKQERTKHKKQSINSRNNNSSSFYYGPNTKVKKSSFGCSDNYGFYGNSIKSSTYRPRRDLDQYYNSPRTYSGQQRRKAVSLPSTENPFIMDIYKRNEAKLIKPKCRSCPDGATSSTSHSWVQRNLLAAAAASAASAASPTVVSKASGGRTSRSSLGSLPLAEGVLRFPKGPDGSKGFVRSSSDQSI